MKCQNGVAGSCTAKPNQRAGIISNAVELMIETVAVNAPAAAFRHDGRKLQIELLRFRRRLDATARDLGLLVHRRERGGETDARRFDALMLRLDDLQADVTRLEKQIAEARRGSGSNRPQPPAAEVSAHTSETSGAV